MNPALLPNCDDDHLRLPKRQKTSHSNADNNLPYGRYTIAWISIANLFLQNGARAIEADLVRIIKNGHSEMTKVLLDKGADAAAADKYGTTPLHGASQYGHSEIVKILLDKGVDAAAADNDGWTPLHLASANGHSEIVKILLEKGVDAAAASDGR